MSKPRKTAIAILSMGFVAYQVYIIWNPVAVVPQNILHVCFAMSIILLMKPLSSRRAMAKALNLALVAIPVVASLHVLLNYARIETRLHFVDPMTPADLIIGSLLVITAVEATRRAMGMGLTVCVLVFIAYTFLGPYMPGLLAHSPISFSNFVENNFLASTGMFGLVAGVSVLYVFYFIMFGGFLEMSGGGRFLIDLAMRLAGRSLGGPAKTAVVASGFMGTISGSAVANVSAIGVMTIPLMKRAGYTPKTAGAIEAISSTGGQLMPPVMGAAAFVLAETTGISYLHVCKAAIVPSILFYLSLFVMVHLTAAKTGLRPLTKEEMIEYNKPVTPRLYLFIPIIVLVYHIVIGASLMQAAFRASITAFLVGFLRAETRPNISQVIDGFVAVGEGAAAVALPCAAAGIIIGTVTLSGVGLKFTEILLGVTGGAVIPTLLLTAFACIILGMGMPTTPAYVMAAVLMAPALLKLGFALLPTHLFVFYFAILSMVTPPVAPAAYTGAGIAGSDMYQTGVEAFRMSLPSFLIPFLFIIQPALLLEVNDLWTTVQACVTALIGVVALDAALVGWLRAEVKLSMRIVLAVAGLLMLDPGSLTDIIGIILFAVAYFVQWKKSAKQISMEKVPHV